MDVEKALRELYSEKKMLDSAIAMLEKRIRSAAVKSVPKRRGRKSMSPQERRAVSERMRRHWATRREQMLALDSAAAKAASGISALSA
jgi:hypothetical protein